MTAINGSLVNDDNFKKAPDINITNLAGSSTTTKSAAQMQLFNNAANEF